MDKKSLAHFGEQKAADYLAALGYTILAHNYRCKSGEIDVIAAKDNCLCFIEVKARSSLAYGLPCQAVNERKRQRIRRAAETYAQSQPNLSDCEWRFDVIELLVLPQGRYLRHVEEAF